MEQFGMSRQLRLPGQQKDRFWRAVVLCALTAAVFFLPFYIMDGGFFHYAGDFNSQQISFWCRCWCSSSAWRAAVRTCT